MQPNGILPSFKAHILSGLTSGTVKVGLLDLDEMGGAVTGATNDSPIVISQTGHGFSTGEEVLIAGVGGNTAANGTWRITVVNDNSYSLDESTGNGAYTSGGRAVNLSDIEFRDDIPGDAKIGTPVTLTNKSVTGGVFNADGAVFGNTEPAELVIEALELYIDGANDAERRVIGILSKTSDASLPAELTGGPVTITWDSGDSKIFRL